MKKHSIFLLAGLLAIGTSSAGYALDDYLQLSCEGSRDEVSGFTSRDGVCWQVDLSCALNEEEIVGDHADVEFFQFGAYEVLLDGVFATEQRGTICNIEKYARDTLRVADQCRYVDGARLQLNARVVDSVRCQG